MLAQWSMSSIPREHTTPEHITTTEKWRGETK